ncbi:MAG: hypothetical protein HRT41_00700 [Campylobacteraceae bacterium]|nr:hypothetical protein [Campylobacteraceae bacterium]
MNPKHILIFLLVFSANLYAHTLLLNVFLNDDNTISIEGAFSTGQKAQGALITLEALSDGKILYKKRLPEISELRVKIPDEPYQVVLDAGSGHRIIKAGIEAKTGFKNKGVRNKIAPQTKEKNNAVLITNIQIQVAFAFAFFLIILSIILSSRNTNKLIKELQNVK